MKKIVFSAGLLALMLSLGFSTKQESSFSPIEEPAATLAGEETFVVTSAESSLKWLAKKVNGQHDGTVPFKKGELTFDGKSLKGGSFELDLSGLTVADIKEEGTNQKLVNHLKSTDFFDTENHPTATLVIVSATPDAKDASAYTIKGNLTIKGITKEISFPAKVFNKGKEIAAYANFDIDRTQFDIKYRSKSFVSDIGNKMIEDLFNVDVRLVAKK